MCNRVVNTRGGWGNKISVDLQYLKNFNIILKGAIIAVGANVTEDVTAEAVAIANTLTVSIPSAYKL